MRDYRQMELFPMSLPEDSHAKTSATPGKAKESSESDLDSGRRCFDSSEMYGQRGQLLKMYQPFDLRGLPWFFKISARSGIAVNGIAYPLVPLARLTRGTGSGSSHMPKTGSWATPRTTDGTGGPRKLDETGRRISQTNPDLVFGANLADQVRMWPTPCANTRPNEGKVRLLRAKVEAGELSREEAKGMLNGKDPFEAQGAVPKKMWPTPTSRDWKDGSAQACKNVPANCLLGREVHSRENYQTSGALNPTWVEWLMGFPIGWTDLSSSATP